MRRRPKDIIKRELDETRKRLEKYLAREEEMLSTNGVQLYTIGSRNVQRYNTALSAVQNMIEQLRKRVSKLEAELAGQSPRRAVAVVPRDI